MPVTARLSRQFYERFGDDVTNELVDWLNKVDQELRTDARAIADDYYARFEARLTAELAVVRSDFEHRLGDVRADLIKWMFVFWAGGTVATVTLVVTFVGLLLR